MTVEAPGMHPTSGSLSSGVCSCVKISLAVNWRYRNESLCSSDSSEHSVFSGCCFSGISSFYCFCHFAYISAAILQSFIPASLSVMITDLLSLVKSLFLSSMIFLYTDG